MQNYLSNQNQNFNSGNAHNFNNGATGNLNTAMNHFNGVNQNNNCIQSGFIPQQSFAGGLPQGFPQQVNPQQQYYSQPVESSHAINSLLNNSIKGDFAKGSADVGSASTFRGNIHDEEKLYEGGYEFADEVLTFKDEISHSCNLRSYSIESKVLDEVVVLALKEKYKFIVDMLYGEVVYLRATMNSLFIESDVDMFTPALRGKFIALQSITDVLLRLFINIDLEAAYSNGISDESVYGYLKAKRANDIRLRRLNRLEYVIVSIHQFKSNIFSKIDLDTIIDMETAKKLLASSQYTYSEFFDGHYRE